MEKVVHLFETFKTIFYFKISSSGRAFLRWAKFEAI
jgi:hypothetical protein